MAGNNERGQFLPKTLLRLQMLKERNTLRVAAGVIDGEVELYDTLGSQIASRTMYFLRGRRGEEYPQELLQRAKIGAWASEGAYYQKDFNQEQGRAMYLALASSRRGFDKEPGASVEERADIHLQMRRYRRDRHLEDASWRSAFNPLRYVSKIEAGFDQRAIKAYERQLQKLHFAFTPDGLAQVSND